MNNQNIPVIDLHGLDRNYASLVVKEFIIDCLKTKDRRISIIHGRGSGILRRSIHDDLKKNKYVDKFYLNMFNDGETIVELNLVAYQKDNKNKSY